ncbi:MAG: hypothetical protein RL685_2509, partial [Pseudomonadota bacterium]
CTSEDSTTLQLAPTPGRTEVAPPSPAPATDSAPSATNGGAEPTPLVPMTPLAPNADPVSDPAAPTTQTPVYAFQYLVYTDEDVTSYVVLTDSLDGARLPEENAREFPGYAFIAASNGQLLVSDGDSPSIIRYEITADLQWREVDRLSFANYGVTAGGAGFERHWFKDAHTAYLTSQVTQRIVWDPTDFVIRSVMDDTALPATRDGLLLDATFNRQPRALQGPVLKPFYYRDEDWFRFGGTTPIAVYDPETHRESRIIEVPCPALEVATQDEAGNTYFSGWTYGPQLALFGDAPAPCVRRIKADATLDETWTPDLTTWTNGRPVHTFRYMRNGLALGTALHVDQANVDFSAGYDETAAASLEPLWRLWAFDLRSETAQEVAGLGAIGQSFNWARFDDRTFVAVPNTEWSRTKVFEIDASGNASERFESTGWVGEWIRVR